MQTSIFHAVQINQRLKSSIVAAAICFYKVAVIREKWLELIPTHILLYYVSSCDEILDIRALIVLLQLKMWIL